MAPTFSIAMPAYNAQSTISRAVDTVLAQTCPDWELVVVDDGSTDDTARLIEEYASRDPRIRVVRQQNKGCGGARDTAVRHSNGTFIVRLDADDELEPNYLEAMAAFIEANPGYDIYSCNGWHVYPDGSRRLARPGEFYEQERSFTLEEMFHAVHIFTVAVYRREIFDRIGGIRPDVYCEDLDFWLRAFAAGARHRYTPQALAVYHVSETQMTADVRRVCESRAGIYEDLIGAGSLTSEQVTEARAAVDRAHQDAWIFEKRTSIKQTAAKVLGPRGGEAVSKLMHASASVVRPVVARVVTWARRRGGDS